MDTKESFLNRLIFVICVAIISFTGLNFISCNFMIPGGIFRQSILKGFSVESCKDSEKRNHDTLTGLLATIIALKTKIDD